MKENSDVIIGEICKGDIISIRRVISVNPYFDWPEGIDMNKLTVKKVTKGVNENYELIIIEEFYYNSIGEECNSILGRYVEKNIYETRKANIDKILSSSVDK